MKKLAIVALPGLLVITAAMGFLSSLTRNNASHAVRDASRETSSPPAAAQAVSASTANQPAPPPAGTQLTTQAPAPATTPVLASLAETVVANFPGYRIPGREDIREAWSASDAGASPFLAQGDFNGDGHTDAALIILGESDWKLVIFEQNEQQHYTPAAVFRAKTREEVPDHSAESVIAVPQHLVLGAMKQGETWAPEAGDVPAEIKLKVDGIRLSWHPKLNYEIQSLIFFEDTKYQVQGADNLLQIR